MTTNRYFNNYGYKPEQDLIEASIIELIQINGIDTNYLPRKLYEGGNEILGEDASSKFDEAIVIEMWLQNYNGYDGSADLASKFGVMFFQDEATLILSKKRWREVSDEAFGPNIQPPKEGDLIHIPMMNVLLEINSVRDEAIFFEVGKKYTYSIVCSLFKPSHETMSTGIDTVDRLTDIDTNNDNLIDALEIAADNAFADNTLFQQSSEPIVDRISDPSPFGDE